MNRRTWTWFRHRRALPIGQPPPGRGVTLRLAATVRHNLLQGWDRAAPAQAAPKDQVLPQAYSPVTAVADEFREPPCCLKAFDRESKDHVAVRLRCALGSTTIEEDSLHLWGLFPPGDDDGQLFVCELHGRPYHGSRHRPLSRHRASPVSLTKRIASLLITTEAMVAERPRKHAAPAMPPGGGFMGDMDY